MKDDFIVTPAIYPGHRQGGDAVSSAAETHEQHMKKNKKTQTYPRERNTRKKYSKTARMKHTGEMMI